MESDIPVDSDQPVTVAEFDAFARQQELAHKKTFRDATAISVAAVFALAVVLIVVYALQPKPVPTTADDSLDSLLRPGPHCYSSAEEMAAARQRALAAIDRMSWERENLTPDTSPGYVTATAPVPTLPSVVEASNPTVPALPAHLDTVSVSDDLCFGIAEPLG